MHKDVDAISYDAVGMAIRVHRELGPGLLERVYQQCLAYELNNMGYQVDIEIELPIRYKNLNFDSAYRIDLLVAKELVIEVKAVESILPVHKSQLLSYLKLSDLRLGLLINFNTPQLKQGVSRIVNNL